MIKTQIKKYIEDSLEHLDIQSDNIIIQNPRNHQDVDYATNIAMILSKIMNQTIPQKTEK